MHDTHTRADAGSASGDELEGWDMLGSALAADALDTLGHRDRCLSPQIGPLVVSQRLVGRAYTAKGAAAVEIVPERPYEKLLEAIDATPAGGVFVFSTDRSDAAGVWGELVTTACATNGVAGALTDGLIRDVTRVLEWEFPVFSRGATPADSKGRVDVIDHDVPVVVDGITIRPGDLVVGDADGVCIVPQELEAQVIEIVAGKRRDEGEFRAAVRDGMKVTEAFRAFGIL